MSSQQESFDLAKFTVMTALPKAVAMRLDTSDQDYYGFVLFNVTDEDGHELTVPLEVEGIVQDAIADLDWDGVVGEDKHGLAIITLRHSVQPDDDPEVGNRCRTCGKDITWVGPSTEYDWVHVDDPANA